MSQSEIENQFSELALQINELEVLDAPWSWGDFFGGVGIGLTAAGLFAADVAIT